MASSKLDTNLETVLGIDSTAGHVGGPDAALTSQPAGSLSQALKSVLAAGNLDAKNSDLALQSLLARAMEGLSGTNAATRSRSAVDVLNFAGSATATDARKALDALSAKQLDLAAEALGLGGPATAESGVLSDSSTDFFNRLSAFRIEETLALSDPKRPRRRRIGPGGTADLLLSGASLLSGSSLLSGASLLDVVPLANQPEELGTLVAEIDLSPQLDFETTLLRSLEIRTDRQQATNGDQALATKRELPANDIRPPEPRHRSIQATQADAVQSVATRPPASTVVPTASPDNHVREPRYAELAAALSMSAAVYRFQAVVSTVVPPGEVDPARTVQSVRAVPCLRPVT